VISGGSCDTEDWSNDAGNPALITGINDSSIHQTCFHICLFFHVYPIPRSPGSVFQVYPPSPSVLMSDDLFPDLHMRPSSLEDGPQRPFTTAKPYLSVVYNGFQKTINQRTPTTDYQTDYCHQSSKSLSLQIVLHFALAY